MKKNLMALIASLVLLSVVTGCVSGGTAQPPASTETATTEPETPPTPTPTEIPEHRILVDGDSFIDRETGKTFVPRGVNHITITRYGDCALAVGIYDPAETDAMFAQLAGYGYNTVRMFLDTCKDPANGLGSDSGGLNPDVLDNIVDLMGSAKEHDIYLLLTSNDLPDNGGYWTLNDEGWVEGVFGPYRNTHYLTEAGVHSATVYWEDLMNGLSERGAPFDAVLAWQLLNEQWYFNNEPPFSLSEGTVTTANGQTYDMSDIDQKRDMANDAIIYWMEQVSQVIHRYDPSAPITMGFFYTGDTLMHPEWDFRYNDVPTMLERAPLDFIDFHAYPGGGYTIAQAVEDIGLEGYHDKPVIMGEFGAFRQAYAEIETGAQIAASWMEGACQAGYDGWLYWVYGQVDVGAPDDPWGFVEADGLIMETLAPVNAPDPCEVSFTASGPVNLAYGASATASRTEDGSGGYYPPQNAIDFSLDTWWSAAEGAPQWIELDLGQPATIQSLKLIDLFGGEGRHLNTIWGKGPGTGDEYVSLATLEVLSEQDELVIEHTLPEPVSGIQFIKVETVVQPGWIIWHEIEVYGTPDE